jgi:hypothetical protein
VTNGTALSGLLALPVLATTGQDGNREKGVELILMWVVVLLLVAAVILDLYANPPALPAPVVRWRSRRRGDAGRPTAEPPGLADSHVHAEAALVSSLLTGDLAQADYRLAMERLAAQDAGGEPLVVPDRDS